MKKHFYMQSERTIREILDILSQYDVDTLCGVDFTRDDSLSLEDFFRGKFDNFDVAVEVTIELTLEDDLIFTIGHLTWTLPLCRDGGYSEDTYANLCYMSKMFYRLNMKHPNWGSEINYTHNTKDTDIENFVPVEQIVAKFFESWDNHNDEDDFEYNIIVFDSFMLSIYDTPDHIVVATILQAVGGYSIGMTNYGGLLKFDKLTKNSVEFFNDITVNDREEHLGQCWSLIASVSLNPGA